MRGIPDYYTILGVHPTAEDEVIAAAYRALAKKYHPDAAGAAFATRFIEIQEAYEVLRDPGRRQEYDEAVAQQKAGWFAPDREPTGEKVDAEPAGDKSERSAGESVPQAGNGRRSPIGMALALGALVIVCTVLDVNMAKKDPGEAVSASALPKVENRIGSYEEDEGSRIDRVVAEPTTNAQAISGEAAHSKTSLAEAPSMVPDAAPARTVKVIHARIVGEMEVDGAAVLPVQPVAQ